MLLHLQIQLSLLWTRIFCHKVKSARKSKLKLQWLLFSGTKKGIWIVVWDDQENSDTSLKFFSYSGSSGRRNRRAVIDRSIRVNPSYT